MNTTTNFDAIEQKAESSIINFTAVTAGILCFCAKKAIDMAREYSLKKDNNMITTKEELARELKAGANYITIGGALARELREKESSRIRRRNVGWFAFAIGLFTAPFTAGASLIPAAVGALTGLTITLTAAELAIIVGGIISMSAIKHNYNLKFNSDGTVEMSKK